MKRLSSVIFIIFSALAALISFLFIVIEGRLLLSFDWTLHEQEFLAFMQYLARLALAIYTFSVAVNSIRYREQKNFIFEGASVLTIAIALSIYATNNFGLYFIILAVLYFGATIFVAIAHRDEDDIENSDF